MRILVAPDKFRDALDARSAADALAAGVRDVRPDAEITCCPLGDGGEGTGRILAEALHAEERTATVLDPLGRPRTARWWLRRATPALAVVEMAEASGVALLAPRERDPLRTTSFGTGQLLQAALAAGARRILLCVGGSATVDGGAGCLQALGYEFADDAGAALPPPIRGGALARIVALCPPTPLHYKGHTIPRAAKTLSGSGPLQSKIQNPKSKIGLRAKPAPRLAIDVLCDVDNPLLGPRGAAPVFAPQKGASPEAVQTLQRGLAHWADVLQRSGGPDIRALPYGGASGGLPAGLAALLGARLLSGFDEVARHLRLADLLRGCDLCLTGEGRLDDQTGGGKVVAGLARLAHAANVPTIAFVGALRTARVQSSDHLAASLGLQRIIVITPPDTPLSAALPATAPNLRRAASDFLTSPR